MFFIIAIKDNYAQLYEIRGFFMEDRNFKELYGWDSLCAKDCYFPWPHTHEFEKSTYPEKACSHCVDEVMLLDAQCLQVAFGGNKKSLLNCYHCQVCGGTSGLEIMLV